MRIPAQRAFSNSFFSVSSALSREKPVEQDSGRFGEASLDSGRPVGPTSFSLNRALAKSTGDDALHRDAQEIPPNRSDCFRKNLVNTYKEITENPTNMMETTCASRLSAHFPIAFLCQQRPPRRSRLSGIRADSGRSRLNKFRADSETSLILNALISYIYLC